MGAILVQPDGDIIISGGGLIAFVSPEADTFGCLDGTVTRFRPDGTLDTRFGCRAVPPNYCNVFDTHLARRSDGRLLMTGMFHTVDGQPRATIAQLSPEGRLAEGFIPWRGVTNELHARSFHPPCFHLATFDTDGQVVVPCLKQNPTTPGLRVYRLGDSGRVLGTRQPDWAATKFPASLPATLGDRGFQPLRPVNWENPEPTGWSRKPPSNRNLLTYFLSGEALSAGDAAEVLRGIFAEVPLELCRNAVRLRDGGAVLLVQEGDAGRFMRFDKDWRADLSYTNGLRARGYLSLAVQKDGRLLVARGSDLWEVGSPKAIGVARLNADGSPDRSFRCEADERVMCLAVQDDGKILIGGFFRKVNGVEAPWLARLNRDGSVDSVFQKRFTNAAGLMASRRLAVKSLAAKRPPPASANPIQAGTNVVETPPATILITALTVTNGIALLQFQGAASDSYILQARNGLEAGAWVRVGTNRTDAAGQGVFRDPGAKDSAIRFYRIAAP